MEPDEDSGGEFAKNSAGSDAVSSGNPPTLEIRCPSCRKASAIPLPPPAVFDCPRCRCELAPLARIRADAAALLRRAHVDLQRGAHDKALSSAAASWDLRHSRASASVAFIAATIACDAPEAIAWLHAARRLGVASPITPTSAP